MPSDFKENPLYSVDEGWGHKHACKKCTLLGIGDGNTLCFGNSSTACGDSEMFSLCEVCSPKIMEGLKRQFGKYSDEGELPTLRRVQFSVQSGWCGRCTSSAKLFNYNPSGSIKRCDACSALHKKMDGIWVPVEGGKLKKACACNGCSGHTS